MTKHGDAALTIPDSVKERDAEEWRLADYLAWRVCGRASGHLDDECLGNQPRDTYFVGNLRYQEEDPDKTQDAFDEIRSKLSPVAFGADMHVSVSDEIIEIKTKVEWFSYYRVFPTLNQQREYQRTSENDQNDSETQEAGDNAARERDHRAGMETIDGDDEESLIEEQDREDLQAEQDSPDVSISARDRSEERNQQKSSSYKDELFPRFRKVECSAEGWITLRKRGAIWVSDTQDLQTALNEETARARQEALADSENLRVSGESHERVKVPGSALETEESYNNFLETLHTTVEPEWTWQAESEVWQADRDEVTLYVHLVNASPGQNPPKKQGAEDERKKENPNVEPFLFDTGATFSLENGVFSPFKVDLAPRGFRYDDRMWGRGFNCAIGLAEDDERVLQTTHTPVQEQRRYETHSTPAAKFEDLSHDPVPVLDSILEAMESYLEDWASWRASYAGGDPYWEGKHGEEFDKDRQAFEREIEMFRRGRDLIRDDDDVCEAFRLTNETFKRMGENSGKDSWRLFQIVFLVSQMPGIASLADPAGQDVDELEKVDVIYFPTGGGKTEAYLSTMTFHCFFDRLRGKAVGVTSWIRFPLRLLTLQQTQRVADVVAIAELVRLEQTHDTRLTGKVAGFAVGYFVGKSSTPNELLDPEKSYNPKPEDESDWSKAKDPKERQAWRRLIYCPSCREKSVEVDFDPDNVRLFHRCRRPECVFSGNKPIPVYIVDNEVYRYLPSIVLGTIDKLAGVGNQRKLSQLFGAVDGKCKKHGYYKGKCCQKDCTDRNLLVSGKPEGLSGPSLFVQDELHLLKEGLGTFDGHYETFIQELKRQQGETAPLKIIASSATIEKFERQVEHLYGRDEKNARVFPGVGPTIGESFYAQTLEHPQRVFVGLIPHNKTLLNASLELIEYYHRETQGLLEMGSGEANPYGGNVSPGSAEWYELIDSYLTSLTYFSEMKTLDSIRTDLDTETNRRLVDDGLSELSIRELTSGIDANEVTETLERLEQPSIGSNAQSDAVLATNMVSHGVDVNRLNAMIFHGMPRQTAEYIQASSRVGRSHVGVVFSCMHPIRERDQSQYSYFVKFHEFMGQLVEPVAINRWATHSIQRTLPGLFMGVVLQLIASNDPNDTGMYYRKEFVQQKISSGEITADDFVPILEKAYQVEYDNSAGAEAFREQIRDKVNRFLDQILNETFGQDSGWLSDALRPHKPMTSLRDVDDPVTIELDSQGSRWADMQSK